MAERLTDGDKTGLPRQWYSRRSGVVRGPFSRDEVSRYLLLGRICLDDELSKDGTTWRSAKLSIELLPAELQHLKNRDDYQHLLIARMQVDERKGERRCQHCSHCSGCHSERRRLKDRRGRDSDHQASQFLFGRILQQHRVRTWVLSVLLVTVVLAWLLPIQR